MRQTSIQRLVNTCLIAALAVPVAADAATVAYWRHEEGPVGSDVSTTGLPPDNVLDSSGNFNHMRTFSQNTAATYVDTVSPVPLRSGLPNTLALDFDTDEDAAGPDENDDNFTDLQFIEVELFTPGMTVELAFNLETAGSFQVLTGKDGQPFAPDVPIQPFAVKVRGDTFPNGIPNQLNVNWFDGDGNERNLFSSISIQAGVWYHVAFTLSSDTAKLYIAEGTGDYILYDELTGEDFAGLGGEVLLNTPAAPFTVGRGMFGGGITDWCNAMIDEVRYDKTALAPSEFLFDRPVGIAPDDDNDGVPNFADVCPSTPPGALVDEFGRPLGDIDEDCDTDLVDFDLMAQGFTGPLP